MRRGGRPRARCAAAAARVSQRVSEHAQRLRARRGNRTQRSARQRDGPARRRGIRATAPRISRLGDPEGLRARRQQRPRPSRPRPTSFRGRERQDRARNAGADLRGTVRKPRAAAHVGLPAGAASRPSRTGARRTSHCQTRSHSQCAARARPSRARSSSPSARSGPTRSPRRRRMTAIAHPKARSSPARVARTARRTRPRSRGGLVVEGRAGRSSNRSTTTRPTSARMTRVHRARDR